MKAIDAKKIKIDTDDTYINIIIDIYINSVYSVYRVMRKEGENESVLCR